MLPGPVNLMQLGGGDFVRMFLGHMVVLVVVAVTVVIPGMSHALKHGVSSEHSSRRASQQ